VESFLRFALRGLGTPAPIAPTKHLVVSGLYRHVRNPMYLGVLAVVVGQGVPLQRQADESTTGPASFVAVDPDGNPILVDQHV
jgi:protein-S-isoprenylcysteine O-methyltransferase Ste14